MNQLPPGVTRQQVEDDLALAAREAAGEAVIDAEMAGTATPEERRRELEEVASQLDDLRDRLEVLSPELGLEADRRAVKRIVSDLAWAAENCPIVARHQVAEAMDDDIGLAEDAKKRAS